MSENKTLSDLPQEILDIIFDALSEQASRESQAALASCARVSKLMYGLSMDRISSNFVLTARSQSFFPVLTESERRTMYIDVHGRHLPLRANHSLLVALQGRLSERHRDLFSRTKTLTWVDAPVDPLAASLLAVLRSGAPGRLESIKLSEHCTDALRTDYGKALKQFVLESGASINLRISGEEWYMYAGYYDAHNDPNSLPGWPRLKSVEVLCRCKEDIQRLNRTVPTRFSFPPSGEDADHDIFDTVSTRSAVILDEALKCPKSEMMEFVNIGSGVATGAPRQHSDPVGTAAGPEGPQETISRRMLDEAVQNEFLALVAKRQGEVPLGGEKWDELEAARSKVVFVSEPE